MMFFKRGGGEYEQGGIAALGCGAPGAALPGVALQPVSISIPIAIAISIIEGSSHHTLGEKRKIGY